MTISLLFSLIIYSMVNIEFVRFESNQIKLQKDMIEKRYVPAPKLSNIFFVDIHEARIRLITRLALLNLGILIFSGGAGYFLAGRTLKPIKETIDEQNRFITDSSHELRTPLTSLRSEIEVSLMDKNLSTTKAKNVLKSNLDEVISLQNLSDSLLELAEGREIINKNNLSKVSILDIINTSVKKTKNLAESKNIKIINNTKDKIITGDFERLTEAFVIIIDNAIKYSPEKSKIHIYSKNKKNQTNIFIEDHGIGIQKEDLDHIFDRFYRSEKSRNEKGYGLGLSIAKKIIDTHNGEIKVTSIPGKKTIFNIKLHS